MTAEIVNPTASESRKRLEIGGQQQKDDKHRHQEPKTSPPNISAIGWTCPRTVTFTDRAACPYR